MSLEDRSIRQLLSRAHRLSPKHRTEPSRTAGGGYRVELGGLVELGDGLLIRRQRRQVLALGLEEHEIVAPGRRGLREDRAGDVGRTRRRARPGRAGRAPSRRRARSHRPGVVRPPPRTPRPP